MAEVVVVGAFTAKPGKADEARAAFEALLEPTHAESGCILYALHQGADDPSRLTFIERWASRGELDAHLTTDHVGQLLARADDLFDASDITVFAPVPGGEARKGSLAEHAADVA